MIEPLTTPSLVKLAVSPLATTTPLIVAPESFLIVEPFFTVTKPATVEPALLVTLAFSPAAIEPETAPSLVTSLPSPTSIFPAVAPLLLSTLTFLPVIFDILPSLVIEPLAI